MLARTTELICCLWVDKLRKQAPAVYGNLVDALGLIEDRLTIYSQFQKRNVKKVIFLRELKDFLERERFEEIRI